MILPVPSSKATRISWRLFPPFGPGRCFICLSRWMLPTTFLLTTTEAEELGGFDGARLVVAARQVREEGVRRAISPLHGSTRKR